MSILNITDVYYINKCIKANVLSLFFIKKQWGGFTYTEVVPQVFRFIGVAMTGRMVTDILSRLVETVAEQGEDMQGYVTELLLTLEAAVDSLESNFRPLDYMRDIFKSTPNLNNKDGQQPNGTPFTAGKYLWQFQFFF